MKRFNSGQAPNTPTRSSGASTGGTEEGPASRSGTDMVTLEERVMTEARARIMRGKTRADVETWLQSHGLTPRDARAVVIRLWKERKYAFKKKGRIYTLIGLGVLALNTAFFYWSADNLPGFYNDHRNRGYDILVAFYMLALFFLVFGLYYLIYGARAYRSPEE